MRVAVNGAELNYVTAGVSGPPVLLVHGFPETWRSFRRVLELLAASCRVVAVDLRGFGDSSTGPGAYDSATSTEDLHQLVAYLGLGPVHVAGQDLSGAVVFRLAASHPEDVLSLTAVETGLAGFGLEALADVTRGGSWHIGMLAAPGIPELLLPGRERPFLQGILGDVPEEDLDEFVRTYARAGGWLGASGLYRSMLAEGGELRALAREHPLTMPVLAVDAANAPFTADTMRQVSATPVETARLEGVGHYVALDAPEAYAALIADFVAR